VRVCVRECVRVHVLSDLREVLGLFGHRDVEITTLSGGTELRL
jgi:hypothetical protein